MDEINRRKLIFQHKPGFGSDGDSIKSPTFIRKTIGKSTSSTRV